MGHKFVVEAKHIKHYVKKKAHKYIPKAADAFIKTAKKAGKDGLKLAKWVKDNRKEFEPILQKALEIGGPIGLQTLSGALDGVVPGAGRVVGAAGGAAIGLTQALIEADLQSESGEETEIEGYAVDSA